MTQMLAIEWAPHGITLNAVAPGRMLTDSPTRQQTASDPGYIERMVKRIPLHRMATAEEIAEAVAYFAGPKARTITGQILVIDGGLITQGSLRQRRHSVGGSASPEARRPPTSRAARRRAL